ncbi:MAG: glutamine--fructose-6-phosphate transaminase (isomerizing) [Methanosarcina thermophila]|jgi:glucosamine--fructose-6-phosphate aminotransferase (isomerizing)|uniref:Glutamine--fructose-6-phosphate aminotransferase [isomerizing] n=3 Tax=Methanosarcina thermophila TaxID=2210 RepID=A0A1I7A3Z3_METTE|nr:glutamine--fructose-6-phosphate transaminase (isomerizing) [Methanosarcina thermophila]ALK05482.1 MAG: glutamine amidotransferase [Methanosarcina sp. 795]AKB14302.1 Glucosamine--fructose-6-phosphate aminotransferase (isomerizing) [Methanosarcina thermophila TM-1]AKB15057.1 Glucosamine--fructose-6-phosphate aminotransferase (isomerizing) [Methanosarcina thermophila CHTI-55]NLU58288.1 glutamine--fructose-6-phosphate transaminase (isomerizing) [Methanosarcina thermophila]SFT69605.1 glutamine--
MCGIVGYAGEKSAASIIVESLKKLEYRGYDSAGISVLGSGVDTYKSVGKIANLETTIPKGIGGNIGIGHTRWATHGRPSTINAHPHNSGNPYKISVVHNGIIENYMTLKEQLIAEGYEFKSETDTEVVAHLLHKHLYGKPDGKEAKCDLLTGLREALKEIEGSYALAIICADEQGKLVLARKDSPLVIGLGEGENFAASDVTAFLNYTRDVIFVDDFETAVLTPTSVEVFDREGRVREKKIEKIEWDFEAAEKAGYEHFMLKEIHEQVSAIHNTLAGKVSELEGTIYLKELNMTEDEIRRLSRIQILACGTSWHAGLLGKYLFEQLAGIHCDIDICSEYRYRNPVMDDGMLAIAITQSGETADTLAAVREVASYNCPTLAITNVVGSTITREVDSVLYTRAGPEIGVAATKTFSTQLTLLYLLAVKFALSRGKLSHNYVKGFITDLRKIPGQIQQILNQKETVKECAEAFAHAKSYFFLGRHLNYPIALEGALKLKEISYLHAEGFAAGELKHGPIALLEKGTPVVTIATKGQTYDKVLSNIKEVKARDATVIAIAGNKDTEIGKYADVVLTIPQSSELLSPLLSVVVLQLLAYYTALARGCSIDKPRNLAKSVTVE